MVRRSGWLLGVFFGALAVRGGGNLVLNPGFEQGKDGWSNWGEQCTIDAAGGRNGGSALKVACTSFEQPRYLLKQTLKLKTGLRYRVGAWMRTDGNLQSADREKPRPLVGLEYWRNGNYGGWVAAGFESSPRPTEWYYNETEYVAGEAEGATFLLMLLGGCTKMTGTVWYDDIRVEQIPGSWDFTILYPMHKRLPVDGGEVKFLSVFRDVPLLQQRLELALSRQGKTVWRQGDIRPEARAFVLALPPLGEGDFELEGILKDQEGNVCQRFRKNYRSAVPDARGVSLDLQGNLLVRGKKYLPVGAYGGSLSKKKVDSLVDAGFNCMTSYNTIWLSTDDRPGAEATLDTIREALDYAASRNVMVALSLCMFTPGRKPGHDKWLGYQTREESIAAIVKAFQGHPALLGWYIGDEPSAGELPWLEKVYGLVTDLDPRHPAILCFNVASAPPSFAHVCDISSFDTYPIHEESNIQAAALIAPVMQEYGQSFWWAGQLMSWKAFKNEPGSRYPTETEILAQNLESFLWDGKGIMNFSTAYLVQKGDEALRGQRHGDWRRANMASAELAPFLLSGLAVPQCRVETRQGHLDCRLFADGNGNFRLLLVAPFAGTTTATITLPEDLAFEQSQRYAVTPNPDGTLTFSGRDVTCDILRLKKK